MKGEDTTVREEVRDIETGWIPWVLAAAYFPVYIVLDFVAGDAIAARLGLPQSVGVGLVSLTISAVVVLLFVLVNVGKALRGPRHSMGTSPRPVRRGARQALSVPVRAGRTVVGALGAAILAVFVVARDGLAVLLSGSWGVVGAVVTVGYRVLSLLLRPFVVLAALVAGPFVTAASSVGGSGGGDADEARGELDAPADRPEIEASSEPVGPLRRPDEPDDGTDRDADDAAAGGSTGDDQGGDRDAVQQADAGIDDGGAGDDAGGEPTAGGDPTAERHDPRDERGGRGDADAPDLDSDADAAPDVRTANEGGRQVVPGDPSGTSRADDGAAPTPGRADEPAVDERSGEWVDAGERSVDDPNEDEWPDDWISASDV